MWPRDRPAAERLLRSYAAYLANLSSACGPILLPSLEQELAEAPQRWSMPNGALLLACCSEGVSGCVALQLRPDFSAAACEIKRFWVEPAARRQGLGKLLLEAAVAWCRRQRVDTLLLDTVPDAMPEAVCLYRSAGFQESERHNSNSQPGLLFMKKSLGGSKGV